MSQEYNHVVLDKLALDRVPDYCVAEVFQFEGFLDIFEWNRTAWKLKKKVTCLHFSSFLTTIFHIVLATASFWKGCKIFIYWLNVSYIISLNPPHQRHIVLQGYAFNSTFSTPVFPLQNYQSLHSYTLKSSKSTDPKIPRDTFPVQR